MGHLACNAGPPLPASSAGFAPRFLPSPRETRRGGGGGGRATSSLRFWAHKQLTHVSHPFEVPGLFVEAEDHSSVLDKLIVSIKDLNDCHMQIHGKKAELHGRLHPPRTPRAPSGTGCCQAREGSSAIRADFLLWLGPSVCPEDRHWGPHF